MRITSFTFKSLLASGFVVASAALSGASAATFVGTLTSDDCTGNCGPQTGGFGSVKINDIGTNEVEVTVTLFNGNKFVSTGAGFALAYELSGVTQVTYSNVTTGFGSASTNPQPAGSFMADGTGTFNYAVACTGCGPGGSSPLSGPLTFDITGTGLSTASFTTNSNTPANFFSVDILSGTTGKTGDVDSESLTAVPLPAAAFLLGPVLGLGYFGVRRRKGRAPTSAA
jgi:hypothetical protein